MHDNPAPTEQEQDDAPDRLSEEQEKSGQGHEDDRLPGDEPPSEPIHES